MGLFIPLLSLALQLNSTKKEDKQKHTKPDSLMAVRLCFRRRSIMIVIEGLSKEFSSQTVLDDLYLTIPSGAITALLGQNGTGKSTLIRLIAGLLHPDTGKISIDSARKPGVLLGGDVYLNRSLTAEEILFFFGGLKGMRRSEISDKIRELDKILNISSFRDKKAATFSRGMRQKIALAISILDDPDVLLLDEPSTGLDIISSNDVILFLNYLRKNNKTILIATHNIFEISDMSDYVAVLKHGKIASFQETDSVFSDCQKENKSSRLIKLLEES